MAARAEVRRRGPRPEPVTLTRDPLARGVRIDTGQTQGRDGTVRGIGLGGGAEQAQDRACCRRSGHRSAAAGDGITERRSTGWPGVQSAKVREKPRTVAR